MSSVVLLYFCPRLYSTCYGVQEELRLYLESHTVCSGKNVLKKSDLAYKQTTDGVSHLYRLVLKPDNEVRVDIDGEEIYKGKLEDDWELLPPKEIADPDDKKPSDWVCMILNGALPNFCA